MTFSAVGAPPQVNNVASTSPKSWDAPRDSFTLKTTKDTFIESVTKGLNSGQLSPDVNRLAEAILSPGKPGLPKVQVKTFAVDGMQAKDIMFIERVPPVPEGPNIVLFIPDKAGNSFLTFNTVEDMNAGLKKLAGDPQWLEAFSEHFAVEGLPAKKKRVIDTMTEFKKNNINAIVGPYATERVDIFARLDKEASAPPAAVNGLTNLKEERIRTDGSVIYSGQQADGTKVFYEYDAYGNFQGADNKGNSYFIKNGLNSHMPLKPMTPSEFDKRVYEEVEKNVGADDIRGLYEELLTHLEHPFSGIGDALKALGVNKNTADTVERYLDNPFSALLLDLNKNNQIGKVFGVDKATMDSALKGAGDIAQGFVPFYGQARGLGNLLAKAIRNEPLTKQETRDMADMLALKPNSPARKNLFEPQSPNRPALENKPTVPEPTPNETQEPPVSGDAEPAPTPPNAETGPNRLRPSQWPDIRHFSIAEGEQLIEGVTPNAKGIYQVKGPQSTDRWMIRLTDDNGVSRVYEIDGRFKLSNGHVQIIDPNTKTPVMTVHSTGNGTWKPVNGPGGKWPWQTKTPGPEQFDPGTYDYPAEGKPSTSKTKEKIDAALKKDASNYHKTAKTKQPPSLSDIPRDAGPGQVIETVYKKSTGMIIGENHSESAALRFLIDHADDYQRAEVKTLYSEGFEHALQLDLDRFFETGEFSPALRENLKLIDRGHAGHGPYTNRNLLLKMREKGIRIKAIDVPSVEPKTTRIKNMNYYTTKVIERDQALNPGEKWVARVGDEHVFTYDGEPPVRGVSQLTGATGVSVEQAPANTPASVTQSRDKTEIYIEMKRP
ncbi:MAG: hypothetical protein L0G75_02220 [Pseudomonas sp.]|nr:hypothetical protein [Pseudomonas sp.]